MSELPRGWIQVFLSDVVEPSSERVSPATMPTAHYIGMEHVEAHTNKILATVPASTMASSAVSFAAGNVLYGRMRPYLNKVVRPKFGGLASAEFIVFPESAALDLDFLLKRFSSSDFVQFACSQYEGDRPRVKFEQLSKFTLNLPPRAEQTRIVAKLEELLSDLDAGVAELKAAQKKLAQYRQSLLKAAVEGALTAAWRTQHQPTETGAQLLQRILQVRRARWEARQLAKFAEQGKTPPKDWQKKYPEPVQPDTSGLPELPQGWVWATAEMLFSWGSGDFLPASAQIDGDYPVYGGNGINGRHNAANVGHATIVIGRVGAHCGNVFRTESAAWVTDNAIYATAKNEFITWAHSELTMQAANLGSGSKGGAQPFISQKILNDTFIALPPIREQERILEEYVVALNSNEEMAASIAISLQQSTAQRQNILRAAFSGQLVPQDPHDEPASVLLERIRAERAAQGAVKKPRGRKAKEAA